MEIFTKEQAKKKIAERVEAFEKKIGFYKSDQYKEANLEEEFLKPLLRYLNWNLSSEGIRNLADREVIVQAKGLHGKEPDYLLRLDGIPRFYIEAKHPRIKLWKDTKSIWQAYSYAYSTQSSGRAKKVDFSLLTDFEEFRFFDCTFKTDKSTVNNFVVLDWKYTDYIDKFEELWRLFEKENVRKGSLNQLYIDEKKLKENRVPPDVAFLGDLDEWRLLLAKDIKKANPEIDADGIRNAVQIFINRFIFLKVLSDRDIEDDYLAQVIEEIDQASLKSGQGVLDDLCKDIFANINKTYNGSLFAPRIELQSITISNKTLYKILGNLLPENSRYNFKQIPVEVLGTIYEHFLGKVIQSTDKRVKIESKPAVRRAGGVYYTPQYIVDYIISDVLAAKLTACNSVKDVFALKICDPACGSGSFLLRAFDMLIGWCIAYYSRKIKPDGKLTKQQSEHVYMDNDGQIRLTAKLKRDLLRNCIFGVDIDPQAVEVSMTSLSLKALEDTRSDELYIEVDLFHESVLPNMEDNIKCGNSLVGLDVYEDELELTEYDSKALNPFDWRSAFKPIFADGGFNCIIGNPPYISIEELHSKEGEYYARVYSTAVGRVNTFSLFLERVKFILSENGSVGFIVSNRLLTNTQLGVLRRELLRTYTVREICVFKKPVFKDASVDTIVIVLTKENSESPYTISIKTNREESTLNEPPDNKIKSTTWLANPNCIFNLSQNEIYYPILKKIETQSVALEEICTVKDGIILGSIKHLFLSDKKSDERYVRFLDGAGVSRYEVNWDGTWLCYDKSLIEEEIKIKYEQYKGIKKDYAEFKKKSRPGIWLRDRTIFEQPKILTRQNAKRIIGIYDEENFFPKNSLHAIIKKQEDVELKFILGILNSKLMNFYFQNKIGNTGKIFSQMKIEYIKQLPIVVAGNIDKGDQKQLIAAVEGIAREKEILLHAKSQHDKDLALRKMHHMEDTIDKLVYRLYDLTAVEVEAIEKFHA